MAAAPPSRAAGLEQGSPSPALIWSRSVGRAPDRPRLSWRRCAVVELGGDPGHALGAVGVVDRADPHRQHGVRGHSRGPGGRGGQPGVERRARHLHDLAQPLHLEGVPVVSDELEAVHQRVSPAKYLAAWRRMSRSVASLACSATSWAFSACTRGCNAASSPPTGPGRRDAGAPARTSRARRSPLSWQRSWRCWSSACPGPAPAPTRAGCAGRSPDPPAIPFRVAFGVERTSRRPAAGTPASTSCGP